MGKRGQSRQKYSAKENHEAPILACHAGCLLSDSPYQGSGEQRTLLAAEHSIRFENVSSQASSYQRQWPGMISTDVIRLRREASPGERKPRRGFPARASVRVWAALAAPVW